MKRACGMTMIELMVVLVILGVLGAMAYPSYARHVTKLKRIEAQVAMIAVLNQEQSYYGQHNTYIPFSADALPPAPRFRWWSGSTVAVSAYELDARACPGRDITECVQVRARPGTERVDATFRDPDCGTLTRDSTGENSASGAFDRCWP